MTEQSTHHIELEQPGITPGMVSGEVHDFIRAHERKRRLLPRAALVGLLTGLVAVAFRYSLDWADVLRGAIYLFAHRVPLVGIFIPIALGAAGAGFAVWLVQSYAPEASGSGIPHLEAVLHRLRGMNWKRILPVKFAGGVAGIGAGMALGREGPTVQMGGAVGGMVAQWLSSTARERQTLIAAGAGAGLAAAFNAPLAGLVFVLEEVQRDFAPTVFTATFVAAVTADVVTRVLLNQLPVFHVAAFALQSLRTLPIYLVLGLACGFLGVVFNRALLAGLRLFEGARAWPKGLAGAAVGAAVGLVGWFRPETLGGGQVMVQRTLSGDLSGSLGHAIWLLGLYFVLRFALTMGSYSSGAPGGIFAPLLVLGTQIGLFIGLLGQYFLPGIVTEPAAFAVVGMAAYFTAIVRAPLTGIVLIVEMTADYNLMLPLLVACFSAYGVADYLNDRPIYEALLERDLLRGQDNPQLEGTLLVELNIQPGSEFEDKTIEELELPSGCLIITVARGVESLVAGNDFQLRDGDRITAIVSPEAASVVARLRSGTGSE